MNTKYFTRTLGGLALLVVALMLCQCEASDSSPAGDGTTGTGGSLARFAAKGNYLYALDWEHLQTFDISEDAQPQLKSKTYVTVNAETIFPQDSLLFLGTENGMYIYDIGTDPAQPRYVSQVSHFVSCDPVVVHDTLAFVTLNSQALRCGQGLNQLQVYNVSDISNPYVLNTIEMTAPKGLALLPNADPPKLFVCDNGLKMLDLSDIQNIRTLRTFNIDATDVIVSGEYLLVIGTDGFYQYAIDGDGLVELSSILVSN